MFDRCVGERVHIIYIAYVAMGSDNCAHTGHTFCEPGVKSLKKYEGVAGSLPRGERANGRQWLRYKDFFWFFFISVYICEVGPLRFRLI